MKLHRLTGRNGWAPALLAAAALALPACVSENHPAAPAADVPRVWPGPPAQARLAYVQSVATPADLGIKSSGWSRFSAFLTGQGKAAVALDKPLGLALDEQGNLCLTDTGSSSVWFFDLARGRVQHWNKMGDFFLQSPVAVAKNQDTFFVADSSLGLVLAGNAQGKLLFTITNHLARPAGLALASHRIYVADSQLHRVIVFDLDGKFLFQFGERGAGPGEFNFPTHLAVNERGQILVTDSMNERVEIFDAQGHFQTAIGAPGDSSGYFQRPKGVAVNGLGHIYVVDALSDNLQIFDPTGQFLLEVGSTGAGPGEFWLPSGVAISRDNKIYVADTYNHRLQVFKYIGPP